MISFQRNFILQRIHRVSRKAIEDHIDQDAIISEKLKLLKTSSLKAEQKQAVVGVLNGKDVMAILPTENGCFMSQMSQ